MRLFGKVDGAVNRLDRAAWLSGIFDLAFGGGGVAGTGIFGGPLEAARDLLANAAAFQTWTGTSTVSAARARTHLASPAETDTRPLAVLALGDSFTARAAEEPCLWPDHTGNVYCVFEQALAPGQSEKDAKIDLMNHVGAILEDAEQLAGVGAVLNMTRSRKRFGPAVYDPRDTAAGAPAVCQASWEMEWEG